MSDEELKAELERLRNENAALKKGGSTGRQGSSIHLRYGAFSGDLVQGAVAEAIGHVGRYSRVHCGE